MCVMENAIETIHEGDFDVGIFCVLENRKAGRKCVGCRADGLNVGGSHVVCAQDALQSSFAWDDDFDFMCTLGKRSERCTGCGGTERSSS